MQEHEPFMHQALSEAEKALAAGEFPVGAVLVYEGEVLLRGRRQHSKAETANELEHAEIIILQKAPEIVRDQDSEDDNEG